MEAAAAVASAGAGGGPAPFLLKTYDMVDDSSTNDIVSWSSTKNSFVVWNPPEFARILLPTYFKHNNFSSFIRQLNTYGFRKIDPERWEFANEDFVKDQKHLLKNIHRRKPIHSHSHPQGSLMDAERATFEDKIEKLAREKATLEANILGFKQQCSVARHQLEDLTQKVDCMEQRQENLFSFVEKAVQDPTFVENFSCKIQYMDIAAYNKKRRLPQVEDSRPMVENGFVDRPNASRAECGNVIPDFSNKLRLELSPASDVNLLSHSTHSSNEDGESAQGKLSEEPKDAQTRTSGLVFAPEVLELSDTGRSYPFNVDSSFQRKLPVNDDPQLNLLPQTSASSEEVDGHISCHLNLSLASTPLQINRNVNSTGVPQPGLELGKIPESRFNDNGKESEMGDVMKNRIHGEDTALSSTQEAANINQAPPVRINDVFWEQFLTERPGSSDNEEASSNYRVTLYDDRDNKRITHGLLRNAKSMERLSL